MFEAPYPPYDPTDVSGFSYETVMKRWPSILTGIVNQVYRVNHDLTMELQSQSEHTTAIPLDEKIDEGKKIIEKVSYLKYQMARDQVMEPIPEDGGALVDVYNTELQKLAEEGKNTWFKAPWLFAECYLYYIFRSYFHKTKHWSTYDPFFDQKLETFRKSGSAIYHIATTMHELDNEKKLLETDRAKLGVLFKEMIQMCLWGNSTDLSLLAHLSEADILNLQSVGKEAQDSRKKFILRDDQDAVWEYLKGQKGSRVDFILDNAGFELFTDFVFADFLVTYTPYVARVVFHPKLIPWFVSDVTPPDFSATITSLLSSSFFPPDSNPAGKEYLEILVTRWQEYLNDGTFALSVSPSLELGASDVKADLWTSPWPYWYMRERANDVWEGLVESGLVIFKGDLNYRKLTGDIQWPASTPFHEAIGPLAGSFSILSLRTNKADVVVGIPKEVADRLDESGEKWRVNGRYAMVSFVPKLG